MDPSRHFGTFSLGNTEDDEVYLESNPDNTEETTKLMESEVIMSNEVKTTKTFSHFDRLMLWSPFLTFKQLTTRDREGDFYCIDAFRALAYFWVQNVHVTEALEIMFSPSSYGTFDDNRAKIYDISASMGVTVFFVIRCFYLIDYIYRSAYQQSYTLCYVSTV